MKHKLFSDHKVAIDIGTTKICVLVARILDDDLVEVIGIGKSPSHGLSKGVVVDIGKTVLSIKNAIREAELMVGFPLESATIGISGAHIQSQTSHGMIPIKHREVRHYDVAQVINSAAAIQIPQGQQVLHVLPQYFIIDSKEKVLDPVGMYAVRLEAQVHIITGSVASVHNLVKCCHSAGINVQDIVLEQLASGKAVLSDDERQLGVAMLDIGGGTSDLAIYHNQGVRHTMVLPVAGNHFTHDVAIGLQTTIKDAERIKREFGIASPHLLIHDTQLEIEQSDGLNTHFVSSEKLMHILHARSYEIFSLIEQEIKQFDMLPFIPTGLVLTGGGSLLQGIKEVAQSIFSVPIRIGMPQNDQSTILINNPMYATGYGLLLHTLRKQDNNMQHSSQPLVNRIIGRMKTWVCDFF